MKTVNAREVTLRQTKISRLRAKLNRSRQEYDFLKNRGVPQNDRPQVSKPSFARRSSNLRSLTCRLPNRYRNLNVSKTGYYDGIAFRRIVLGNS